MSRTYREDFPWVDWSEGMKRGGQRPGLDGWDSWPGRRGAKVAIRRADRRINAYKLKTFGEAALLDDISNINSLRSNFGISRL